VEDDSPLCMAAPSTLHLTALGHAQPRAPNGNGEQGCPDLAPKKGGRGFLCLLKLGISQGLKSTKWENRKSANMKSWFGSNCGRKKT